jgi:mannitol 2-dehydrogenase
VNKLRTLYPIHNSWQITGLHLLPSDKTTWNDLKTNRYEYTLIEKEDTITSKTKINSITDSIYLPDPKEFEILSKKNTNELKWITMTLTEKGYYKKSTNSLEVMHPRIQHDIASSTLRMGSIYPPNAIYNWKTIYGLLFEILYDRYSNSRNGISILSCDNIKQNSKTLCKLFMDFMDNVKSTSDHKERFLEWVQYENTFPNTMVDRITPIQNQNKKEIVTEQYFKWVIENDFVNKKGVCLESPPLEYVDVTLCDKEEMNVHENMKLELLNGSHALIAYLSFVYGHQTVQETLSNDMCRKQIDNYQYAIMNRYNQIERKRFNIKKYCGEIMKRFDNTHINDEVIRLRMDGGQKIKNIYTNIYTNVNNTNTNTNTNPQHREEPFYWMDSYLSQTIVYYIHYLDKSNIDDLKTDPIGWHLKKNKHWTLNEKLNYIFEE